MGKDYVIAGGGPAAYSAAAAIREKDAEASVVIITDEKEIPYNRPMLTKSLMKDQSNGALAVVPAEWYEENRIKMEFDTKITAIDTAAKSVTCEGSTFAYDKLIYALGAYCFVPPIKGADQRHVVSIRKIEDADKVKAVLGEKPGAKVVVLGGGVMGLESAWDLKEEGYDVTVIETAPGLLQRQLDDTSSAMLGDIVVKAGVNVITGSGISEIREKDVVLTDGSILDAELVIISTGMRPHTAIAAEAGIAVDRLVVVDEHMQTNIEDVFACGDCVEYNGQQQAFLAQAMETGRVAGSCAAGGDDSYENIGSSLIIQGFNTGIFALGANGRDQSKTYEDIEIIDPARNVYEKYYFENKKLEGVILVGDLSKMGSLMAAVADKVSISEIKNNLKKDEEPSVPKKEEEKMAKFVCSVCGYVHEGSEPPEKCPVCNVPASKFNEMPDEMTWAAEHVVGVASDVPEDIKADLRANFEGECSEVGMYLAMARVAHREGYPEIGLYWEKAAYEEAEHAAKFAELLGEVLTDSTKKNLEMRVEAEFGATAGKTDLAVRAKKLNLDAIHDTVHEMARDEARHGKALKGLLERYFG